MLTEKFLLGRGREDLSAQEKQILEDSVAEVRSLPPRHRLVRAGQPVQTSTLLLEGFICRYMDDRDGLRQAKGAPAEAGLGLVVQAMALGVGRGQLQHQIGCGEEPDLVPGHHGLVVFSVGA